MGRRGEVGVFYVAACLNEMMSDGYHVMSGECRSMLHAGLCVVQHLTPTLYRSISVYVPHLSLFTAHALMYHTCHHAPHMSSCTTHALMHRTCPHVMTDGYHLMTHGYHVMTDECRGMTDEVVSE